MKALYMLASQGEPTPEGYAPGSVAEVVKRVELLERSTGVDELDEEKDTHGAQRQAGARGASRRQGRKPRFAEEEDGGEEAGFTARWAEGSLSPVPDPVAHDRAVELVVGTLSHLSDVDALLGAVAEDWPFTHLAAVDRAVLRLGAHELLYTETPAPIVINDAVELVRRYSTQESPRFVNGVLGALAPSAGGRSRTGRSGSPSSSRPVDSTRDSARAAAETPGVEGIAPRPPSPDGVGSARGEKSEKSGEGADSSLRADGGTGSNPKRP